MKLYFDHINLSVAHLAESELWYKNLFTFEKVEGGIYENAPWSIMRNDQSLIALYEEKELRPADDLSVARDDQKAKHRIYHFGIQVSDKEEWLAKVKKFDAKITHEIEYPHSTSWYVSDPSGHEIEVSYWPEGLKFNKSKSINPTS
jgi:catechol-2,3-dioxygenase